MMKILIVEDEMFVSWGLESALVDRGYRVCGVAQTAEEAVAMADRMRPDLIFMDIGLYGADTGLEAARLIQSARPTRIVFSSAWNDEETLRAIDDIHPFGNIPKPCRESDLIAWADRAKADIERSKSDPLCEAKSPPKSQ
jgi:DNA-binding NarL/FixJ family response regulator